MERDNVRMKEQARKWKNQREEREKERIKKRKEREKERIRMKGRLKLHDQSKERAGDEEKRPDFESQKLRKKMTERKK